ncbi:MAG TPA: GTP-dependent dephospho-CoA kinase family protein [Candidatus Nanoarchaeia archaeon]|nr:GTP-dependent dephospho-CoA kinase family protein [Candidatus Nanoarchaeia archaeon]
MPDTYIITSKDLSKFQEPFGLLIQGTSNQTMKKLKILLAEEETPMIVSVGDTVSRNLDKMGIQTHLSITDNKSHRRKLKPQNFPDKELIKVKNPPGTITSQATAAVQEALLSEKPIHMLVEGEEDLLTLISVLHAPENAFVIYGQPHKGIVVVKVTPKKRAKAEKILKSLKTKKEEV